MTQLSGPHGRGRHQARLDTGAAKTDFFVERFYPVTHWVPAETITALDALTLEDPPWNVDF
jgi:hypothetical protein